MTAGGSYDPKHIEPEMLDFWDGCGALHAQPDPHRRPFSIVIPPPNVTGALHLGHAINNTLQDILTRRARMKGFAVCWLPGTDHAGIATQAVVERRLRQEQGWRRDPANPEHRSFLVGKINEWKDEYEARILGQLRRMGCSCDWNRTRFTLDEQCAKAVYELFFRLFRDGYIYRGRRLVNWDCELQTAVADDEVYHESVKGNLWHIRYPILPDGADVTHAAVSEAVRRASGADAQLGRDYLVVATTRPETMLADTAVAVHPGDARYQALIGRSALLPLMHRPIPVVADGMLVNPEFGTGCVKVTPGHDPSDYACWQRHEGQPDAFGILDLLTSDGKINDVGRGTIGVSPRQDRAEDRSGDRSPEGSAGVSPVVGGTSVSPVQDRTEDREQDRSETGPPSGSAGVSPASRADAAPAGPFDYVGLPRQDARKKVVADLEALGLLEKVEPYETEIGHSDRSKTPIEPLRSEQWFVRTDDLSDAGRQVKPGLAEAAMDAVRDGRVRFFPERFAKSYLDWLGEKRDWCISRQLWWGHRIPVWHCRIRISNEEDVTAEIVHRGIDHAVLGELPGVHARIVATSTGRAVEPGFSVGPRTAAEEAPGWSKQSLSLGRFESGELRGDFDVYLCIHDQAARAYYEGNGFVQDPDVLDTWFSSALWPLSTWGWPADAKDAPDLGFFAPTNVLSTARDIISLWVARMVMVATYLTGRVPFQHVCIHPTIQDGQGRRMSKSLGNGVDPLDLIELYGADAMRFTLASMAGETQDVRIPVQPTTLPDGRTVNSSERFELGRNFCNKIWQAATGFVIPNLGAGDNSPAGDTAGAASMAEPADELALEDRWILSRLGATLTECDRRLDHYQYSDYAGALYSFFWSDFCDWYVELVKPRLYDAPKEGSTPSAATTRSAATARRVLAHVLDVSLRLLHPVVPFVTEKLWALLSEAAPVRGMANPRRVAGPLITAAWPDAADAPRDAEAEAEILAVQEVIRAVRELRTHVNATRAAAKQPALRTMPKAVVRADEATVARLRHSMSALKRLGQCDEFEIAFGASKPPESMSKILTGIEVYVPVGGLVDLSIETKRLEKERGELAAHIGRVEAKLSNESFAARAPATVVEAERARLGELREKLGKLEQSLRELSG